MVFSKTCMSELPAGCNTCLFQILKETQVPVCIATGCVVAIQGIDANVERLGSCPLVPVEELLLKLAGLEEAAKLENG